MKFEYLDFANQKDIIEGVVLRKLTIHKDESGMLVETLRSDWRDVVGSDSPFAMQYLSQTPTQVARDEDQWHFHKHQKDRFICISGRIVTALFDPRESSPTKGKLNLFLQGPDKAEEMYMVLIPEEVYHGFMVISKSPGYLLNFPTQLYTGQDEGRIKNDVFSWQDVRFDFS
ncbi:dTDP-4-dehydrorhamnose 3,5-epimerase family protein [Candidatus Curtissbacteria bacterium]|nr:dTDP-4-dehydrorhamnose 3,5-epimerase family protein [Candidatus Curtissbacteria bacterium]